MVAENEAGPYGSRLNPKHRRCGRSPVSRARFDGMGKGVTGVLEVTARGK